MKIITRTREQVYRLWIKALRSGHYRQTEGQLRKTKNFSSEHTSYAYCCLGVLQDLAVKDGGAPWATQYGEDHGDMPYGEDGEPKKNILKFLGLTDAMVNKLVELNDNEGASFEEIANHINKNIIPKVCK
jgi:hypothetical protein